MSTTVLSGTNSKNSKRSIERAMKSPISAPPVASMGSPLPVSTMTDAPSSNNVAISSHARRVDGVAVRGLQAHDAEVVVDHRRDHDPRRSSGARPGDEREVEVGLDARARPRTRTGSRSRSASPVATMPGILEAARRSTGGCSPWNVHEQRRVGVELDLEPLPSPNVHGGSRCSSPISQFTRTVITGSPSTVPSHVNRCAATVPGSITPTGVSIGAVATAISWVVRLSASSVEAELGRDHVDRLHEARRRALSSIGLASRPPRASCRTA